MSGTRPGRWADSRIATGVGWNAVARCRGGHALHGGRRCAARRRPLSLVLSGRLSGAARRDETRRRESEDESAALAGPREGRHTTPTGQWAKGRGIRRGCRVHVERAWGQVPGCGEQARAGERPGAGRLLTLLLPLPLRPRLLLVHGRNLAARVSWTPGADVPPGQPAASSNRGRPLAPSSSDPSRKNGSRSFAEAIQAMPNAVKATISPT